MVAVRATCMLIALALFVHVLEIDSLAIEPTHPTTAEPPLTTPDSKSTAPTSTATSSHNTDITIPITTSPTTANPPTNTTIPPTPPTSPPTSPPTTAPTIPPTTPPITTAKPTTTTQSTSTTAEPPTTPAPSGRQFDGLSFMGGMILTTGSVAIGFILWKFYKARTERNYHTL